MRNSSCTAFVPGEKPVEQRRSRPSHVKIARRRRRETHARLLGCAHSVGFLVVLKLSSYRKPQLKSSDHNFQPSLRSPRPGRTPGADRDQSHFRCQNCCRSFQAIPRFPDARTVTLSHPQQQPAWYECTVDRVAADISFEAARSNAAAMVCVECCRNRVDPQATGSNIHPRLRRRFSAILQIRWSR